MSYVLHVWEQPAARKIAEALALIEDLAFSTGAQNPKFVAFAKALTDVYPDMYDTEESDEEEQPSVWVDSPMDGKTNAPVYVLSILPQYLTDHLILLIAHAAADNDLHVFDIQKGRLYRPDQTVIDDDARVASALPALPHKPTRPKLSRTLPSKDDTKHYLFKRFLDTYSRDGWTLHDNNGFSGLWYVGRQIGQVTQKLQFNVSADRTETTISVAFGFVVPEVYETIAKLAPKHHLWGVGIREKEDKSEREGVDYRDISMGLDELFPFEQTAALGIESRYSQLITVRSIDELALWSNTFLAWFQSHLHEKLNAARNIKGLSRLFDSEWFREKTLAHGPNSGYWLTYLLIEHLAETPQFQVVADNIRYRAALALRHKEAEFLRLQWLELLEVVNLLVPPKGP